jgi:pyruvate dehydrogenase E2 component (dihydrolipoamide acetyltransferase)
MPSLGADMEDGTLVEWRVQPGAAVRRGDIVALVETTKGIIDIESFEEGEVERLLVQPGDRVLVGAALAIFSGEATGSPVGPQVMSPAAAPAAAALPTAASPRPPAASQPATRVEPASVTAPAHAARSSPAARALAQKLGVDIASVRGTGPGGAVSLQDVEAAARPRAGMREAIGAALGRSKREIPHYYLQVVCDFGSAREWLQAYNDARPVPERLLPTVLLIKAVAKAAADRPGFNGYFQGNRYAAAPAVHVGVAIAMRGGGLVAPAIMDADRKPLATIMSDLQALVGRVRGGHMRSGELSAGTITLTSLGEEGVEAVWPIIYPPQVAIVGFGSVLERPWVIDGKLTARPVLHISLAADHRVSDGRQGAQFIAHIADLLQRPAEL